MLVLIEHQNVVQADLRAGSALNVSRHPPRGRVFIENGGQKSPLDGGDELGLAGVGGVAKVLPAVDAAVLGKVGLLVDDVVLRVAPPVPSFTIAFLGLPVEVVLLELVPVSHASEVPR